MLTLVYPWLLLMLPAPWLVARLVSAHHQTRTSVRVPRLRRLAAITGQEPAPGAAVMQRSWWATAILWVLWALALVAVARPQLVGEPIVKTNPARDLLLAVDLSGSMDTVDFTNSQGEQVDRLTAVKEVLDEFLTRREGDRVGLIFFGSAAFVQAPFTEDLDLCRTLLDEAQARMAGPQTVVGDAVGLALTVFERSEQEDRVLILLTDGNDTGSQVPPDRAAAIARDKGVTIHTVAVGDPTAVGEAEIDEEVLQQMAQETGGGFFRAADRDQLAEIYDRLDQLETRELETESYRPKSDLFQWPIAAFLLIGLAYHAGSAVFTWRRAARAAGKVMAAALAVVSVGAAAPAAGAASTGFHFLRPVWLVAVIPAALLTLAIARRQDATRAWRGIIDENLLRHLLVKPPKQGRFGPLHLLAVVWLLAVLALAGPTWRREPAPFTADEAAVVFAIEVTPTMLAQDVQPSRLERGVHKIRDLLALRGGAKSALIAYAGSAHLVMPITSDADIIGSFAAELQPEIMPKQGDAAAEAIKLGGDQLRSAGLPGSIVLITDGIDVMEESALRQLGDIAVHILAVAGDQSKPLPLGSPPAPAIDIKALEQSVGSIANATLTVVTPDEQDVQRLNRNITTSFVAAQQEEGGERWMDMGYWLTPWIAAVVMFWFRPGWVVKWE